MFSNSFHQAKKKPLFSMKRAKMEDFSPLLPPVPKDGRERQAQKKRGCIPKDTPSLRV